MKTKFIGRTVMLCMFLLGGAMKGQNVPDISEGVQQQIADLLAAKNTFTTAERKMSSHLVFAARQARGVATGIPSGLVDPRVLVGGMVEVEIKCHVTLALLKNLATKNARIKTQFAEYEHIHAEVTLATLHLLAEDPDIISIREADEMTTNIGALTSQGYISHQAREVVHMGITGAGVKVGVLSDSASATRVAALIASGELGNDTVILSGQAGSGTDEGAAMMEIIHDLAPGAQIYFATANPNTAQFANNISALAANGCSIIVDDVTYFAEGAFQDDLVARAVNTFVSGGGLYFSAAANSGNLTSGTSGTWEGDFLNGGAITNGPATNGQPATAAYHNFGTAGSSKLYDTLTAVGSRISLKWADPLGGSTNDYDLFLLDSAGTTLKGSSLNFQGAGSDPLEYITNTAAIGDRVVVVLSSGAPRALRVDTHRGVLTTATMGSTFGHNGGQNTISMAATHWNSARTGTVPFNGSSNHVETFSSDGPRRIFYTPTGTPIVAGNFLFATGGGTNYQKPDFTACDAITTKTPGFFPFYGTSCAAPHAAAIAALVKSARPALTGPQIRQILRDTAMDNMAVGPDRDGGYGILNARAAVAAALAH